MVTFEPISAGELTTRTGRVGVVYGDGATGKQYEWDPATAKFVEIKAGSPVYRAGAAISGTATITAAQLATGALIFSGGAGTQTLPTATLIGSELRATQGTTFDFVVDNTAGSGTCTVAVGTGITAAAVITGGNTLTVANSATVGVAMFRLAFFSATGAVLYRLG